MSTKFSALAKGKNPVFPISYGETFYWSPALTGKYGALGRSYSYNRTACPDENLEAVGGYDIPAATTGLQYYLGMFGKTLGKMRVWSGGNETISHIARNESLSKLYVISDDGATWYLTVFDDAAGTYPYEFSSRTAFATQPYVADSVEAHILSFTVDDDGNLYFVYWNQPYVTHYDTPKDYYQIRTRKYDSSLTQLYDVLTWHDTSGFPANSNSTASVNSGNAPPLSWFQTHNISTILSAHTAVERADVTFYCQWATDDTFTTLLKDDSGADTNTGTGTPEHTFAYPYADLFSYPLSVNVYTEYRYFRYKTVTDGVDSGWSRTYSYSVHQSAQWVDTTGYVGSGDNPHLFTDVVFEPTYAGTTYGHAISGGSLVCPIGGEFDTYVDDVWDSATWGGKEFDIALADGSLVSETLIADDEVNTSGWYAYPPEILIDGSDIYCASAFGKSVAIKHDGVWTYYALTPPTGTHIHTGHLYKLNGSVELACVTSDAKWAVYPLSSAGVGTVEVITPATYDTPAVSILQDDAEFSIDGGKLYVEGYTDAATPYHYCIHCLPVTAQSNAVWYQLI